MNPIMWVVNRVRDMIWRWQFAVQPIQILGNLLVKEYRGCWYCVGMVDDITVKSPCQCHYCLGGKIS